MRKLIKSKFCLVTSWLLLVAPVFGSSSEVAHELANGNAKIQLAQVGQCLENSELDAGIATFKSFLAGSELERVHGLLMRTAERSPSCRAQIIQGLMAAMSHVIAKDPPLSNVGVNQPTYYLWQNATNLLAKLQATEALDLLIANLGLTDGWSVSVSHYPAIDALIRIGQPAIPKLEFVLHNNSQPHMRKFAVFCISLIGGVRARNALSKALSTESDPCVNKFMRISLDLFGTRGRPNSITPADGKWYSAFYCLPERD